MGRSKEPEPDLKAPQEASKSFQPIDDIQFTNWFDAMRTGKPEMLNAEIEDIYLSNAFLPSRQHFLSPRTPIALRPGQ